MTLEDSNVGHVHDNLRTLFRCPRSPLHIVLSTTNYLLTHHQIPKNSDSNTNEFPLTPNPVNLDNNSFLQPPHPSLHNVLRLYLPRLRWWKRTLLIRSKGALWMKRKMEIFRLCIYVARVWVEREC
jgi:hypothetical protein